jgi:carbamoyltransferase
MRILGTKFWGHDSALYFLDTEEKEIFALSTDRVTRVKHDMIDVTVALEEFPVIRPDVIVHSYGEFGESNLDVENRKDGVISLLNEKIRRDLAKSEHGLDPGTSPDTFTKSHDLYADVLRITQLDGAEVIGLPNNGGVHRSAIEQTFKLLLARAGHFVPVEFADHHLCHAMSAYFTSPYAGNSKALVVTLDGWGDYYFGKTFIFSAGGYIELGKSPAIPFKGQGRSHVTSIGELYAAFTEGLGFQSLLPAKNRFRPHPSKKTRTEPSLKIG